MRILVIDDLRTFETAEVTARDYKSGIAMLQMHGPWDALYLDHDLGEEKTGYDVMCWLEEHPEFMPKEIKFVTDNPVGRQKMEAALVAIREREFRCRKSEPCLSGDRCLTTDPTQQQQDCNYLLAIVDQLECFRLPILRGFDPTFYRTGSYERDLKIAEEIEEIRKRVK